MLFNFQGIFQINISVSVSTKLKTDIQRQINTSLDKVIGSQKIYANTEP